MIVVAAAVVGAATARGGSAQAPLERVTVISDSIASSIAYNTPARTILANGIDLDLQLAQCRRLVGESCPHKDVRPPTLVDLVPTIELGTTAIVIVGYNDYEDTFAASVEAALQALDKGGAKRILWLTMRAERQSYLHMNDIIREAATRHPEVTVRRLERLLAEPPRLVPGRWAPSPSHRHAGSRHLPSSDTRQARARGVAAKERAHHRDEVAAGRPDRPPVCDSPGSIRRRAADQMGANCGNDSGRPAPRKRRVADRKPPSRRPAARDAACLRRDGPSGQAPVHHRGPTALTFI